MYLVEEHVHPLETFKIGLEPAPDVAHFYKEGPRSVPLGEEDLCAVPNVVDVSEARSVGGGELRAAREAIHGFTKPPSL